jgi:predicted nucleic acid-binding protein
MTISGADRIGRLVLDTSAYSHFRKRHATTASHIARADAVLIPVTVLGELEAAFRVGSRAAENRVALADFLAEQFVFVLDVTRNIAQRYGELFAQLRRAGTPLPSNDIWIAAATIDAGGHLLTFDSDFGRIETLPHTLLRP